jgi:hypothetical protein
VSGYHSTGHSSSTTLPELINNDHPLNMTLPLQDQTTEAARRDSGTTKVVAVDGSASSKYIKWNASGVEVEQPNEKEKIQAVSDQFNRFQMMSRS